MQLSEVLTQLARYLLPTTSHFAKRCNTYCAWLEVECVSDFQYSTPSALSRIWQEVWQNPFSRHIQKGEHAHSFKFCIHLKIIIFSEGTLCEESEINYKADVRTAYRIYRVSQEECARLRESVPYVKSIPIQPKTPMSKVERLRR